IATVLPAFPGGQPVAIMRAGLRRTRTLDSASRKAGRAALGLRLGAAGGPQRPLAGRLGRQPPRAPPPLYVTGPNAAPTSLGPAVTLALAGSVRWSPGRAAEAGPAGLGRRPRCHTVTASSSRPKRRRGGRAGSVVVVALKSL